MPVYRKNLDVQQGYDCTKEKRTPVGFITKLQIGAHVLAADQTVKAPGEPTQALKVVAVMNDVLWEGGLTDALYLAGQISANNRQQLALITAGDTTNIHVVCQFSVYEHDLTAKAYVLAFHGNGADLHGLVARLNGEPSLSVGDEASREVLSPENYPLQLGIKPQRLSQALHLVSADRERLIGPWGQPVE